MQTLINNHLPAIRQLCARHRVRRLWVFGSVLTDDFTTDSDIDFLYEFDEASLTPDEELDLLLGMVDGLQRLLSRPVDFVWYGGLRNPFFKTEVEARKQLVYEQESEEVPV